MFTLATVLGWAATHNNIKVFFPNKLKMKAYFNITLPRTNVNRKMEPWKGSVVVKDVMEPKVRTMTYGADKCLVGSPKDGQNILVDGWLQSFKYFEDVKDEVRQQFTFVDRLQTYVKDFHAGPVRNKALQLWPELGKNKNEYVTVGLHSRRGDMVHNSAGMTSPPVSYYVNAMKYFKNLYKHVLFVFVTADVKWAKAEFKNFTDILLPSSRKVGEDMAIIASCDHTIVSVGSYGWWGAWLANGTTVYYNNWPRPKSRCRFWLTDADYFPAHWIPIGA